MRGFMCTMSVAGFGSFWLCVAVVIMVGCAGATLVGWTMIGVAGCVTVR